MINFKSLVFFILFAPIWGGSMIGTLSKQGTTNPKSPIIQLTFFAQKSGNNDVSTGTGVKIAENVILTAAHCLKSDTLTHIIWNNSVVASYQNSKNLIKVSHFEIDTAWRKNMHNRVFGDRVIKEVKWVENLDIALIYLDKSSENFDAFKGLNNAKLDFKNLDKQDTLNIWGYGANNSNGDINHDSLIRQVANVPIFDDSLTENLLYKLHSSIYPPTVDLSAFVSNSVKNYITILNLSMLSPEKKYFALGHGDSGGPIFKGDKVVGINSSGMFRFGEKPNDGSRPPINDFYSSCIKISSCENFIKTSLRNNEVTIY